jgi:hypothetical protein
VQALKNDGGLPKLYISEKESATIYKFV